MTTHTINISEGQPQGHEWQGKHGCHPVPFPIGAGYTIQTSIRPYCGFLGTKLAEWPRYCYNNCQAVLILAYLDLSVTYLYSSVTYLYPPVTPVPTWYLPIHHLGTVSKILWSQWSEIFFTRGGGGRRFHGHYFTFSKKIGFMLVFTIIEWSQK